MSLMTGTIFGRASPLPAKTASPPIGRLAVIVEKAELVDKASGTERDVFTKVRLGQIDQKQKTKVHQKAGTEAVWGAEFIWELTEPIEKTPPVHIDLKSQGIATSSLIGSTEVRVGILLSAQTPMIDKWFDLFLGTSLTARVNLRLTWSPYSSAHGGGVWEMDGQTARDIAENNELFGLLKVTVKSADSVKTNDLSGYGDPFCTVAFGQYTFRTKTALLKKSPVWNASFNLPVLNKEKHFSITFSLYDKDIITENDFLGTVAVPISPSFATGHSDLALDMYKSRHQTEESRIEGTKLHVSLTFTPGHEVEKEFWATLITMFDDSKDGLLDRTEAAHLFDIVGCTITNDELEELFQKLDANSDNLLSLDELLSMRQQLTEIGNVLGFKECPVCHKPLPDDDARIICHVASCLKDGGSSAVDLFMTQRFVTEQQMSSGWLTKLFGKLTLGSYSLDSGHIIVQDRQTGALLEEKIPPYVKVPLVAMYRTTVGKSAVSLQKTQRMLQEMSVKMGPKYNAPSSAALIPDFIKLHDLNVAEVLEPLDSFKTFNEFFYRKLKPDARPIDTPADNSVAVCGADCRLVVFPSVTEATVIWIKGRRFSVRGLLGCDDKLAQIFDDGAIAVFRLAPQDYHRFHSPVAGTFGTPVPVDGVLYTVNPIAVRQDLNVFTENKRVVCTIDTVEFGKVAYVCVGATLVGSIIITATPGQLLNRGDEIGYFAFGGSTIITVFQKDRILFSADLVENSQKPLETLVQYGSRLGTARQAL